MRRLRGKVKLLFRPECDTIQNSPIKRTLEDKRMIDNSIEKLVNYALRAGLI